LRSKGINNLHFGRRVALAGATTKKEVVMKSRVTSLSIGIALVAVAAVQAQDKTVAANVPFSFYMGSSAMPQGAYKVAELSHGWVVSLWSKETTKSVTARATAGKKEVEPARLVFHRYGESYFLAEIWSGDGSIGRTLAASPREKELAHNGAAPTLSVIRLALRQ
jgi:hypothetical protein